MTTRPVTLYGESQPLHEIRRKASVPLSLIDHIFEAYPELHFIATSMKRSKPIDTQLFDRNGFTINYPSIPSIESDPDFNRLFERIAHRQPKSRRLVIRRPKTRSHIVSEQNINVQSLSKS
jgi:hypothetical protein